MTLRNIRRFAAGGAALAAWAIGPAPARAQSVEPRAYSPAPAGVNFLILGYADSRGGLPETTLPLTDPKLEVQGPLVAYARTFALAGKSAKVDAILPIGWLSGSAGYLGQSLEREAQGLGDPQVRLSVNFIGAPALDAAAFRAYRQDLIVGASLQVSAPFGQYDDRRALNLGTNRWSFKPEIGLSKALGRWTVETAASVTVYTVNADFFGGRRRAQDPLYSARANLIYNFRPGMWASFDATFYTGGQTTLDGGPESNLQRNWRVGVTLAAPLTRRSSLKLNASRGVSARTGNNYDLLGVAWQYRWGGGF